MVLTGCQSYLAIPRHELEKEYIKRDAAEENLRRVKDDYEKKVLEKEVQVSNAKDLFIKRQDEQMQAAADTLYSITRAAPHYPQLGALEFTKDKSTAGFVSLGKSPSIKELMDVDDRIGRYITSYAKNDIAEINKLKQENQALINQNKTLAADADTAKAQVNKLNEEKGALKEEKEKAVQGAQTKLDEANKNVATKSKEALAAAEAEKKKEEEIQKAKREIMIWCGIGAALAMAGAVYSPVGKGGLIIISAILGFVSIAVMHIEGWMILTVGIAGIAAALIYVLYKHHIAETSNDNIINAIQDVREKSGESYTALKQSLKEWNTVYKKDASGNMIEVPDKRIEDYVSKKLAEYGRLNTKK
jgi:hypothetical protein